MKHTLSLLAFIALSIGAQAQYYPGQKPTVRTIDSVQIAGVPVNTLTLHGITLGDSIVTVGSSLSYSGRNAGRNRGNLSFSDTFPITDTTNVSVNSLAIRVAALRGVNIH